MPEVLSLIMRWLHISSMAMLVGGFLYSRIAASPASNALSEEDRETVGERAAAAFRPFAFAAMAGLALSGVYNLLSAPGHTPRYHMFLGMKLLLAAHVFAVGVMIVQPNQTRRARLTAGAIVSGFAILLISAYLRRIF